MVTAMTDVLHSSGISDDDMRTEEFGDYTVSDNPVHTNQISKS
jgi:hypothetical protein